MQLAHLNKNNIVLSTPLSSSSLPGVVLKQIPDIILFYPHIFYLACVSKTENSLCF